jgi:hypothetical protein
VFLERELTICADEGVKNRANNRINDIRIVSNIENVEMGLKLCFEGGNDGQDFAGVRRG